MFIYGLFIDGGHDDDTYIVFNKCLRALSFSKGRNESKVY